MSCLITILKFTHQNNTGLQLIIKAKLNLMIAKVMMMGQVWLVISPCLIGTVGKSLIGQELMNSLNNESMKKELYIK